MNVDRPQRGVEWDAAVEGETNSVQDWERILSEWPFIKHIIIKALANMENSHRPGVVEYLCTHPTRFNEESAQFIINLASLSNEAFQRIKQALDKTEKG